MKLTVDLYQVRLNTSTEWGHGSEGDHNKMLTKPQGLSFFDSLKLNPFNPESDHYQDR